MHVMHLLIESVRLKLDKSLSDMVIFLSVIYTLLAAIVLHPIVVLTISTNFKRPFSERVILPSTVLLYSMLLFGGQFVVECYRGSRKDPETQAGTLVV